LAIRRIRGRSYNSGSAPFAFYRYYVLTLNPVESISYRKTYSYDSKVSDMWNMG
jgi:hypothetical protein